MACRHPLDTFTAYGATDGTFYLVRPDRHVAARWKRVVPREVRQAFCGRSETDSMKDGLSESELEQAYDLIAAAIDRAGRST